MNNSITLHPVVPFVGSLVMLIVFYWFFISGSSSPRYYPDDMTCDAYGCW